METLRRVYWVEPAAKPFRLQVTGLVPRNREWRAIVQKPLTSFAVFAAACIDFDPYAHAPDTVGASRVQLFEREITLPICGRFDYLLIRTGVFRQIALKWWSRIGVSRRHMSS